jgi:N-acetylneuraminic acid mutarotase
MNVKAVIGSILCVLVLPATADSEPGNRPDQLSTPAGLRELSFEDRVAAQRAIERVYWSHRIWPKDNPAPKPAFEDAVPESTLRQKVEDSLKGSAMLERIWGRRIAATQLQGEVNRIVRGTRQPAVLNELFHALGDDPPAIAETLARASLVNRLLHSLYAADDRIHASVRSQARAALATHPSLERLKRTAPVVTETTWRLAADPSRGSLGSANVNEVSLDPREWRQKLESLANMFGGRVTPASMAVRAERDPADLLDGLPISRPSDLQENAETLFAAAVVMKSHDAIKTVELSWPKRPFSEWWSAERAGTPAVLANAGGKLMLPAINRARCTPDSWRPTSKVDPPTARYYHTAVWTGEEMLVWGGYSNEYIDLEVGGRYDPSTDVWQPMPPSPNEVSHGGHTVVWTGSEMIVWGGFGPTTSPGSRYDPSTDSWSVTSTGTDAPDARFYHTAVWTGSEMIIWGGDDIYGNPVGTGGRYDPSTDRWKPTSTSSECPTPRSYHTAVWTGGEMIVWGGVARPGGLTDTGGRYDPLTDSWRPTSRDLAPIVRWEHTAVWSGGEMIVWGGLAGGRPSNDGGRYDPATDSWRATSTAPGVPEERSQHSAVWAGTEMIVWGGNGLGSGIVNSGGRYDPIADTWRATSMGANAASPRVLHTGIWTGEEMIVWGGASPTGSALSTGARYDPLADRWQPMSVGSNMPARRAAHHGIWTGSEMIIWGGGFNQGGRYDPATDSWTATSAGTNTPSVRSGESAVWTGSEMIIWGGGDSTGNTNTGGRYDPVRDVWTPTAVGLTTPLARRSHTAVWTGSEMIVWGGVANFFPYMNSGGRYDPGRDTWTPTSSGSGAPEARFLHTAIWTGSRMIVWGGRVDAAFFNSGASYDPAADAWTPTSRGPGVPTERGDHTAVWTGKEMIVWGGDSNAFPYYHNDGSRYDVQLDAWRPVAHDDATPELRTFHTAIWTGSEMIVWGGSGTHFPFYLNSGGRYDPAADRWRPTSSDGSVPTGRQLHTAVWTGAEMIVWGGGYPPTNTGGRLCVAINHPPVANAGPDQALECAADSAATATLDGSASIDIDSTQGTNDDITITEWSEAGSPIATGLFASVLLQLGAHDVTLTVTDEAGATGTDDAVITIRDTQPPTGSIVSPVDGECLGPDSLPVRVLDDLVDACDPTLSRSYDPPGPSYSRHGDYHVTLTARDASANVASAAVDFTIDTVPPVVTLVAPGGGTTSLPASLPLAIVFRSADADGAAGEVVHETISLQGCVAYDGATFGNRDGLLRDETIALTGAELCRIARVCGFTELDDPELQVVATDCGGNAGVASTRIHGRMSLGPRYCSAATPAQPTGPNPGGGRAQLNR